MNEKYFILKKCSKKEKAISKNLTKENFMY
jgi:hypothetical protein